MIFFINVRFLVISILFISSISFSQMLDNSEGKAFTDAPFFNTTYIKANRIKSISGKFTKKKVGDIIRETDLSRTYVFDKEGRLIKTLETIEANTGFDTIVSIYEYDENNNLIIIRKSDPFGFSSTHYAYDDKNRIIREEFRRSKNKNNKKADFKLGEEFIVSFETFSYESLAPNQVKKTFYNSYNIAYKDEITYLDEFGMLDKKEDVLRRTSGKLATQYFYNSKNLLDSVLIDNKQTGYYKTSMSYKYDNLGNLDTKLLYRKNKLRTRIEVIYNNATLQVDYILTQQVSTGYLTILKLNQYEKY